MAQVFGDRKEHSIVRKIQHTVLSTRYKEHRYLNLHMYYVNFDIKKRGEATLMSKRSIKLIVASGRSRVRQTYSARLVATETTGFGSRLCMTSII